MSHSKMSVVENVEQSGNDLRSWFAQSFREEPSRLGDDDIRYVGGFVRRAGLIDELGRRRNLRCIVVLDDIAEQDVSYRCRSRDTFRLRGTSLGGFLGRSLGTSETLADAIGDSLADCLARDFDTGGDDRSAPRAHAGPTEPHPQLARQAFEEHQLSLGRIRKASRMSAGIVTCPCSSPSRTASVSPYLSQVALL